MSILQSRKLRLVSYWWHIKSNNTSPINSILLYFFLHSSIFKRERKKYNIHDFFYFSLSPDLHLLEVNNPPPPKKNTFSQNAFLYVTQLFWTFCLKKVRYLIKNYFQLIYNINSCQVFVVIRWTEAFFTVYEIA